MRQQLSLFSLRAFEAAARRENLTAAAGELRRTPGAISKLIQRVESEVGFELFERRPRGIVLTAAGRDLHRTVARVLAELDDTTERLAAQFTNVRQPLILSASPALIGRWLLPRLSREESLPPIHLNASNINIDYNLNGVDCGIRLCTADDVATGCASGSPDWRGIRPELILEDALEPLCAPHLAQGMAEGTPDQIETVTLLCDDDGRKWQRWLHHAGFPSTSRRQAFNDDTVVIEAALDGLGLCLTSPHLVRRELEQGRLVHPFRTAPLRTYGWWLCSLERTTEQVSMNELRAWLLKVVKGFTS